MAKHLVIIEAPGKRKLLSNLLFQVGLRDVDVQATVGHLAENPSGLKPLAIDACYREQAYALKPSRQDLARRLRAGAAQADVIWLATDDDQEGDVIARDVLRFCVDETDHSKVRRLRLRALEREEIRDAVASAQPFDAMAAAKGDARRVLDRLIGGLSSAKAAVGRVQGSLLLMLNQHRPVIGVSTFTAPAGDGKGEWTARRLVRAGDPVPAGAFHRLEAELLPGGPPQEATQAARPMNHDQIVLTASLATGSTLHEVSDAMQSLYESGRMTYPRAKDMAVTPTALRRLHAVSQIHGVGFQEGLFKSVRAPGGEHAHEAPNSLELDLPLNRNLNFLTREDQVLVLLTRHLLSCGMSCTLELPAPESLAGLPPGLADLPWRRVTPTALKHWSEPEAKPGFKAWTHEQSLLHFMHANSLGRPSTVIAHIEKFLTRELLSENLEFTSKADDWCYHVGELFGHRNISRLIENYIDEHRKPSEDMVAEMVTLCGLKAVDTMVRQQDQPVSEANDEADDEISAGPVY